MRRQLSLQPHTSGVMMRQICPGPCQFCTTANNAYDTLETFHRCDTHGVKELTPDQVAQLMVELRPDFWTEERTAGLLEDMKLNGQSIIFEKLVKWLYQAEDPHQLAKSLHLKILPNEQVEYEQHFQPPVQLTCGLLIVPHGRAVYNQEGRFQNHADGETSELLPEGMSQNEEGVAALMETYGRSMRDNPDSWVFYRSPLKRCRDTFETYQAALQRAGIRVPEATVDVDVIEINHGSWGERDVSDLIQAELFEEAALGELYKGGSFLAKPGDASGESLLDVVARAAEWLKGLQARHSSGRTNVIVFGHGTFQNAVELLLRVHPGKSPAALFSRGGGGSHMERGHPHIIVEPL